MPAHAPSGGGGAAWRHLLLLLTALPLVLALLAFALQWRGGGVHDPASRWPPNTAEPTTPSSWSSLPSSSSSSCAEVLAASSAPAFPYLRGWLFPFHAPESLHPKVCVQTIEHLCRAGPDPTRSSASPTSCSSSRARPSSPASRASLIPSPM